MRMKMNHYPLHHLQFGRRTAYSEGILTIRKEALQSHLHDEEIFAHLDLDIASPGEPVRVVNIMDISAPRVKAAEGQPPGYYPGVLCKPYQAGNGTTHALQGCAVMEIGQMHGLFGGLVDMQGRGAELTPFSQTHNLCVVTRPRQEVEKLEYAWALKRAGLKAAVYLAEATLDQPPSEVKEYDLNTRPPLEDRLPRVGYLFQLYNSRALREAFLYGAHYRQFYPTLLHPNEILDGALVCGHYDSSFALRNPTYALVNHPIVQDLYSRHGREIDFRGVVIVPEPTTLAEIQRTAMMSAGLLKHHLDVDGVIITKEGGGHTSVDMMANCDACEALGIRTVLIDNEWLGPEGSGDSAMLNMTSNADAMVSIGNMEEEVALGPVERVIGGSTMAEVDGDLRQALKVPIRCIPEAVSQLGAGRLVTRCCTPDGLKRNIDCRRPACLRASDLLLKKIQGRVWKSEIPFPDNG